MTPSFRLGRIAGMSVGVHWSVLIIFVLITWGLSTGLFPAMYPGYPLWAYLVASLGAAVVFFLGLLAHELSHAVLAKRNGLSVESITLWMLGGVARLGGEARNPGAELRVAGVGPLVSLLIGVAFAGVAGVLVLSGNTGLILGTFTWLAGINVVLAVFNVLPAAPLDGGRLLRAGLWKLRGDPTWAAIMSARAGRVLGGALFLLGLWLFLTAGAIGHLWLALVGWFLFTAAGAEEQQAQLKETLRGVRVRDVMSRDLDTAPADISVAEFIDHYLLASPHSAFPLTDGGQPVGLVTLARVKRAPAGDRTRTRLREIACPASELTLTHPDEQLIELLTRLNGCADRRALVIADHRLVGIVSSSDISRAVQLATLRRETARS